SPIVASSSCSHRPYRLMAWPMRSDEKMTSWGRPATARSLKSGMKKRLNSALLASRETEYARPKFLTMMRLCCERLSQQLLSLQWPPRTELQLSHNHLFAPVHNRRGTSVVRHIPFGGTLRGNAGSCRHMAGMIRRTPSAPTARKRRSRTDPHFDQC